MIVHHTNSLKHCITVIGTKQIWKVNCEKPFNIFKTTKKSSIWFSVVTYVRISVQCSYTPMFCGENEWLVGIKEELKVTSYY